MDERQLERRAGARDGLAWDPEQRMACGLLFFGFRSLESNPFVYGFVEALNDGCVTEDILQETVVG